MKVLIEIDDYQFAHCKRHVEEGVSNMIEEAIVNGKLIPSNATNGIAVETAFPNIEITEVDTYKGIVSVELDWWNSQYKNKI